MSLNPILSQDIHTKTLLPICVNGEAYVLSRPQTRAALQLSTRKLIGTGDTIMTTHRIVFIKKQDKEFKRGFSSINVPFSHIEHPRFEQPVFGTNHIKFRVKSDNTGLHPLESDGELKIYFISGGADLFLKLFFTFYARFRNNPNLMSTNNPINELEGDFCAFVDPSDTSHVYYTQPETSGIQRVTSNQTEGENQEETRNTADTTLRLTHSAKAFSFLRFIR